MFSKNEIIEGIRCEKCYPRRFGEMVNNNDDNLYLYQDLAGNTRCFCVKHMTFFTKSGAMVDYTEEDATVGYGAILKSEILKQDERI